MGFFSAFTGSSQKKQIRKGAEEAKQYLTQGETKARGELTTGYAGGRTDLTTGYQAAIDRLDPYTQQGNKAQSLYGQALGLDGQPAQQEFYSTYAASDPFRQFNEDRTNQAIMRSFNAGGNLGSGRAALAASRANLERGSIDLNAYLDRLAGVSQSGQQVAGQIAGYEANRGQQLGNLSVGQGSDLANLTYGNAQQLAGNQVAMRNGIANAQTAGVNNWLKLGELAVQAATGGGGTGGNASKAKQFLGG